MMRFTQTIAVVSWVGRAVGVGVFVNSLKEKKLFVSLEVWDLTDPRSVRRAEVVGRVQGVAGEGQDIDTVWYQPS